MREILASNSSENESSLVLSRRGSAGKGRKRVPCHLKETAVAVERESPELDEVQELHLSSSDDNPDVQPRRVQIGRRELNPTRGGNPERARQTPQAAAREHGNPSEIQSNRRKLHLKYFMDRVFESPFNEDDSNMISQTLKSMKRQTLSDFILEP
jgi:hypothetical protein